MNPDGVHDLANDAIDSVTYAWAGVDDRHELRDLREAALAAAELRKRAEMTHGQIMGLLVGNPAANAAERLRHLRITDLLAA